MRLAPILLAMALSVALGAFLPTVEAQPAFVAVGTLAASTGVDVTPALPVGWEPDDILLLIGVVRDQDDTLTLTGWTAMTGTPFNRNAVSRYWVYWLRATASTTAPLFDKSTATGDTFVQIIAYRRAFLTGDPWEVKGTPATGTADPAPCTGLTSLTAGDLIVAALAGEDDNNAAAVTTGTQPINYVEHYAESATGTDGMIVFSEMERQAAGATGTVSVNFDTAVPVGWGCQVLALKAAGGGAGADGYNSLVATATAAESPGANCAYGGTKVTFTSGLDNGDGGGTARNGVLEAGEIDATTIFYSCTGATGATGADGADGADGANGADGARGPAGPRGPPGSDGWFGLILAVAGFALLMALIRRE